MTAKPDRFLAPIKNLAVLMGIVFGVTTAVLLLAGAPPLSAYVLLFKGALGSWIKFSHVIKAWVPLTLCASGLLFTFRIGLWNIGVEGQVMMGAVFCTAALKAGLIGGPLAVLIACICGIVGGALWAAVAALLKTRGGVHEIFAGLGLNFVAQGTILWLIFGPWKRPGIASMSGTELFARDLWLPQLATWRVSPPAVLSVVVAIGITAVLLHGTRFGLVLKAVGRNARAAFLFGISPKRYMLLAMLMAGGFAGLAGGFQVSGVYHRLIPAISSNYGYLALLVAMLANNNIRAVPLIALFFACLNVGSIQLPMALKIDSSLGGVIQGMLVLAVLAVQGWRQRRQGTPMGGAPCLRSISPF